MVTSKEFYEKYGHPSKLNNIVMWDVPPELEIGVIPKRIYCNKDLIGPLSQAFSNLIHRGFVKELKTWDGCYNFRPIRGYEKKYAAAMKAGNIALAITYLSTHSWGGSVDVNGFENGLGKEPKLSPGFVKCFTDAGLEWGGTWKRKDGMHFQLAKLPPNN
jgi:hypothetical protein